ncbi:prolyl oligopeptidase family serine peptidase [Flocculibacter collagenilyticus]|uniref:prolyl oligopeptidase family serine peptidase n=1 Tax=Flocculibacter collagenilyticus TaxID=2744479 RepID=UPI0018F7060E|nr:prolyl oligopeptidase family serine peptidase [Flocculibacter collagenilyticus]
MKFFKPIFVFIYFISASIYAAQPISAEKVFTSPDYGMLKISPNGELVSFYGVGEKDHYLSIYDADTSALISNVLIGNDNTLKDYHWLNNSQLFLSVVVDESNRNLSIIGKLTEKTFEMRIVKTNGYLVDTLPEQPNKVMFAKKRRRHSKFHDLYIIDIAKLADDDFSDAQEIEHDSNYVQSYFYDQHFQRVLTAEFDKDDSSISVKFIPIQGGEWKTAFILKDIDFYLEPLGFISEQKIAILTNQNTDKIVLREFDIQTQKIGEIIYQHPDYDLVSAGFTSKGKLDYVSYRQHGLYQKTYFDKGKASFVKRLAKTFPNMEAYSLGSSANKKKTLLYVNGADEPGEFLLFDENKNNARRLLNSYPELSDNVFSPSERIEVTTSDDVKLEAFLTLPQGVNHSTLLVMPHGGPIGVQESDRFNKEVQYFASRGFAVLRVNFRGSAGFGKAFLERGVGEFGQLIEQDITTAVEQVTKHNKFDHMCAIGASYGGYSATMLAIKHPTKYDCVIATFGIYDLPLLFNASNYRSGKEYREFIAKTVGENSDKLIDVSPVYIAHQLKAPILLIAGRDDRIADFEHSNRFKYILNNLGHPVETIFYQKTGHGHSKWSGDRHEAAITYDYLIRTLNLSYPEPKTLDENGKHAIANDFATIADGYHFDDLVDNDEKQAFLYYQKAASYDHGRASFNIAAHYHRGDQVTKDMDKAISIYRKSAELDYAGAHARLGRMYMEGEHVNQDWSKAYTHLKKAQSLDDTPRNNIRLARFYCIAPPQYQNISRCLELMELNQYKKHSKHLLRKAQYRVEETLSWVFAEAKLTPEELEKIKQFTIKSFNITHTEVTLENTRSGLFHFKESERFGTPGEYQLIDSSHHITATENEKARFGLKFEVDTPGIDRHKYFTAMAIRWIKTTPDGKREFDRSTLLYGSPKRDWSTSYKLANIKESATWTLEIYNMDQKLIHTKDYHLTVKAPR